MAFTQMQPSSPKYEKWHVVLSLLQRNVCKTRTLLFSPPLRNIISCNFWTGLRNMPIYKLGLLTEYCNLLVCVNLIIKMLRALCYYTCQNFIWFSLHFYVPVVDKIRCKIKDTFPTKDEWVALCFVLNV
jgi:hypothetical protein